MSKFCQKCDKEIPESSQKDICKNCENKMWSGLRKVGEILIGAVTIVGGVVHYIINGKSGNPKA